MVGFLILQYLSTGSILFLSDFHVYKFSEILQKFRFKKWLTTLPYSIFFGLRFYMWYAEEYGNQPHF